MARGARRRLTGRAVARRNVRLSTARLNGLRQYARYGSEIAAFASGAVRRLTVKRACTFTTSFLSLTKSYGPNRLTSSYYAEIATIGCIASATPTGSFL